MFQLPMLSRKPVALGSITILVLGVVLILIPALPQSIFTLYILSVNRNIDLLFYVNIMNNMFWINAIPMITGSLLLCVFASRFILSHRKVDASKIKCQSLHLASWSLIVLITLGCFVILGVPTSKAMSTATTGYILDTPISDFDYFIGQYSDGNYFVINGSTWDNLVSGVGSTMWAGYTSNYTKLEELVRDSMTSGLVFLKDVMFNYSLTIPENIAFVENINGLERQFININNSQGSPYTVSVDTVQANYYLTQDSDGRYINSWSTISPTTTIEYAMSEGGLVAITDGAYTGASIDVPGDVFLVADPGVTGITYASIADGARIDEPAFNEAFGGYISGSFCVVSNFTFSASVTCLAFKPDNSIYFASTDELDVLQSCHDNLENSSVVTVRSPFITYGILNISKPITFETGLKAAYSGATILENVDFFTGTVPFIQTININSSSANLAGITIQGFNIQNINFATSNSKFIRFVTVRDCYFHTNTTNHGVSFSGEGLSASYFDSIMFDNCFVFMEDGYGLTYGAFTFGNSATHMTNIVMNNLFVYINNSNQTVFFNDGTAQLDDLRLEAYILSESYNTDINVFCCAAPVADIYNTFHVNWHSGSIESASNMTIIKILDYATTYQRNLIFDIHNLDFIDATTESATITLLDDAMHSYYQNNRQILFHDNVIQGNFAVGSSAYMQSQDLRIRGNLGYNPLGAITLPVAFQNDEYEYFLVDSGGDRVIPSSKNIYVYGSGAVIYGNAASATTIVAITLNGQAVSATLPIIVDAGQYFNITYTGGAPIVIKQ